MSTVQFSLRRLMLVVLLVASVTVLISNLTTRHIWTQRKTIKADCESLRISTDSKKAFCRSSAGKLTTIDLENGATDQFNDAMAWTDIRPEVRSPDNSKLLVFGTGTSVKVWKGGLEIFDMGAPKESVVDAAWVDNNVIAVLRSDGSYVEIDIHSYRVFSLTNLPGRVRTGVLSTGTKTAIVSLDGASVAIFERPPDYIGFWSIPGPWLIAGCFVLMFLDGRYARRKAVAAAKEQASPVA